MKIILEKNQNIFFSSDSHYNHQNICRGVSTWPEGRGTRDFHSLGEMNDAVVSGINSVVGENDYLVHMGDWSFGGFESIVEFRKRIVCKNIILFWVTMITTSGTIRMEFRNTSSTSQPTTSWMLENQLVLKLKSTSSFAVTSLSQVGMGWASSYRTYMDTFTFLPT